MKNLRLRILTGVASLALGSSAYALPITYQDVQAPHQSAGGDSGDASGTFSLLNPAADGTTSISPSGYGAGDGTFTDITGYTLHTTLSDATATFYLSDDRNHSQETIDIDLGEYDGTSWTAPTGSGSWTKVLTIGGGTNTLSVLENNGTLTWDVGGNYTFTVDYAMLTAHSTGSASVPDGGATVALLGLGVLGLAGLRRRLIRR